MFSVQQSTELVVTPARCDNTIHDGFAFSACTFLYKKKKSFPRNLSAKEKQTNKTYRKPALVLQI